MSPTTIVCVLRSGGVYSPLWVERLARHVRAHLWDASMVCLTDMPGVFPCHTVPLHHNWPGWFSKIELFRPGLFSGPGVYFDLDTLLLGPVDFSPLFADDDNAPRLWLLSDFFSPSRAASGVMAWTPCDATERIYHDFAANPQIRAGWSNGDGSIIGRYPHARLQTALPGVFGSYKADKLHAGPRNFRIVCQHGKPKFNDLPETHWMVRKWKGE